MAGSRISKAEFDENNRRDKEFHTVALLESARTLERAAARLKKIADKGTYTTGEMQEIRKEILQTVRLDIDPFAHPVMSEKRSY
jgi:hypothetical protein